MWIRIRDSESFRPWIRDGKIRIRDKHLGSATLDISTSHSLDQRVRLRSVRTILETVVREADTSSKQHHLGKFCSDGFAFVVKVL